MNKKIEIKRLLIFLLIAFGLVWGAIFTYFGLDGEYGTSTCNAILMLAMLCPAIAALVTIKLTKEKMWVSVEENRNSEGNQLPSLRLGISFKNKKWVWFPVAIFGMLLCMELGYVIIWLIEPDVINFEIMKISGISKTLATLIPIAGITSGVMFSIGALGEELGWRSYMVPKMEKLFGTVGAILLGNIIWGIWHFPSIAKGHAFGLDYKGAPYTGYLVFTLSCVAMGAFLQLLVEKANSVWPAVFAHAINNTGASILGMCVDRSKLSGAMAEPTVFLLIHMIPQIILGVVSVVVLVRMRKKQKEENN